MKQNFKFFITLVLSNMVVSVLHADSVQEISQKHYLAMLEDLQTYIAEQPNAADINEARSKAVEAAFYTDQKDVLVDILQDQFDAMKVQEDANPQELAQTGMMLVQFSKEAGKTDVAKNVQESFYELAEKTGNPIYAQVSGMIDAELNKPGVGTTPELSGTSIEGKEIELSDYEGKVVLLDFWATWCGPCIAEMPNVISVYEKYHEKGFEIIGISLDRSIDPLKEYIKENEISWPNIYDADQANSIADQFSITAIPTMFIIDQEGKIVAVNTRGPELEKAIAGLLEE